MELDSAVVLVTGANRGLGRQFAALLLERGATRVYAAARNPDTVDLPGVVPLQLDITDPASIERAAAIATDATLLINNAGISLHTRLTDGPFDRVREELETNFFGTLAMTRAFAPILAANGNGAILNVLSALSWVHLPEYGAYCASKAAAWAMSNVARQELAPQGTQVTALHVGYLDTDMASYVAPENKSDPAEIAAAALDALAAGATEIIGDETARAAKAQLAGTPASLV